MPPSLHPGPRPRDVLREQLRLVRTALRAPFAVALAAAVVATLLFTLEIVADGEVVDFRPEQWILPGLLGLLLPLVVWKGEDHREDSLLWTLPVDRRKHALSRVFGGWIWLMVGVALFVVWLLGLALLSGGNILTEETLRFLPSAAIPAPGGPDPAAVRTVRWAPEPWLWLIPFTAATATYLLGSALALGATVRGVAGGAVALFLGLLLIGAAGELSGSEWLTFAPSRVARAFVYEPYGLATLLTASSEFFAAKITIGTGETVVLGRGVPEFGRWATAAAIWLAAGAVALWAAVGRHRERRGP